LFERYTENARRAIYFARYEASVRGTAQITAEQLLLSILRKDKTVASRLGWDTLNAIRKELDQPGPPGERTPTSVDLPISLQMQSALELAVEEADALGSKSIDTPHLILGLLRVQDSLAAQLLRKHGLAYAEYRELSGRRDG